METEATRGLLIDPFKHEILAIELMDPDEELLTKLLRCEAIERYTIFVGEDDFSWELCTDRDSTAKLATHPQWSLVPPSEFFQQFIPNPEHRVWFHSYALLLGRSKDGLECSLPEHITPLFFAQATQFGFTDWWRIGIPEDFSALLRNFVLEPAPRSQRWLGMAVPEELINRQSQRVRPAAWIET